MCRTPLTHSTQGIITYPPVQICLHVGQYTAACAVREEIVMQAYLTRVPDQIRLRDCVCARVLVSMAL